MEFLLCKQTGKLVPLSEQYMIDCGRAYVKGMSGCSGGTPIATAAFIRNFGLHLQAHYPYKMREDQCPYEAQMDLRETGYLRLQDFSSSVAAHIELWPDVLRYGPLLVCIATGPEFREFGGGVWSGETCPPRAGHAALVVGHGREDNRDYWIIRNSHGTSWGEQGYMKLDKRANCFPEQYGYVFGVDNPKLYNKVAFGKNGLHSHSRLTSKLPKSQ